MSRRLLVLVVAPAIALTCTHARRGGDAAGSLPAFRSEAEISGFLREIADERERRREAALECAEDGAVVRSRAGDAAAPERSAVIRGRVSDGSGAPLEGAAVSVPAFERGTLTAADGSFRVGIPRARLAADTTVSLHASLIGFEPRGLELSLSPGDSVVVDFGLCPAAVSLDEMVVAEAAFDAPESVTNVQHAGVDEGGIVKVHGDHLVVLRRGRLFTVDIGGGRLETASVVDAYAPDMDPRWTWYDEMLVSGDDVVVIGYSYIRGGTEIGRFRIDDDGRLRHRATYHLRSNDYYSSRNYSSRLIGTDLVLYTPLRVPLDGRGLAASLPAMRRWRAGVDDDDFRPIAPATRVYRPGAPLDGVRAPTLHTVTVCDLAATPLACEATSVLGPQGRVFYVSPTAVYVWVATWPWHRHPSGERPASMLYRMPLDGSAPGALRVEGSPVDQFSFLESDDGHLNVLVRGRAAGDGMWRAEFAGGEVSLLRVRLDRFSDGRRAAPPAVYRALPEPEGGSGRAFRNRFVRRHVLYGTGSGWGRPARDGRSVLYAVRWEDGAVARLSLPHGVDRIEVMGADAAVIGTDGRDLHFTGIDLGALPDVAQRYVRRDAAQGELRSHGFFYRSDAADSGVLGLPIRGPGRPGYEHLFAGSAAVVFLRNEDQRFRELGELVARAEDRVPDDGCVASCVDWYGNARPLFLRDRIFALLGYEVVEGAVRDGRIREIARVSFAPRAVEVSRR